MRVSGQDGVGRDRLPESECWQVNRAYEGEMINLHGAVLCGEAIVYPVREAMRTTRLALEARRSKTEATS